MTASRSSGQQTGSYVANDRRRVASMVRYGVSAAWAGLQSSAGTGHCSRFVATATGAIGRIGRGTISKRSRGFSKREISGRRRSWT